MNSNNPERNKSISKKLDWIEIINVFHKYLPDEFPLFEKVPNTNLVYLIQAGSVILSTTENGILHVDADPNSISDAAFKYVVLNQFAREYSTENEQNYIYANLPFQFAATHFIKHYMHRVYDDQMKEMLLCLGIGEETIDRSIRNYRFKFKLRVHQKFARDFITFQKKQKRSLFSFDEICTNLKVKESQLKKWSVSRYLKDSGIVIDSGNQNVIYRRRKK